MKKSQILAALALAFALGVVAPVAGTYAYSGVPGISNVAQTAVVNSEFSNPADLAGLVATTNAKSVSLKYTGTSDITLASHITINDGRTVNLDLGGKKLVATRGAFKVDNGSLTISNGTIENQNARVGALQIGGGIHKTDNNGVAYASHITIAADATIKTAGTSAIVVADDNHISYGAVVDIYGTVEGVTTNGNLTTSDAIINVHNGAKIEGKDAGSAIYAAGVATWNIDRATLTGGDGIYAKAGTINLNGTTVKATADYTPGVEQTGTGSNTGSAIAVEANDDYAGDVTINVNAGTTLESKDGYAIYQFVDKAVIEALNISNAATVTGKLTVNGASIQGVADEKINYAGAQTPNNPADPSTPADPTTPGADENDPSAPGTGLVSTAEGNAATTVSIVAGLATALTALGAGVVAYRSARRSNK